MEAITALAEQLGAPVITTFKAKGQIADDHPLACGVLGRSGTPIASWFMNESDALLVLGASFSNHTGIYPGKPIVQVDFDPLALGKFHPVTVPVWGEIGVTVELLAERPARGRSRACRPAARARRALGDLARREGQSRRGRPRPGSQLGRRLRRDAAPRPRAGGDRRRRRQQRLLVRPLLRVQDGPDGPDVRLPRLDRVRLPGGDRRLGRSARAADLRRHRRRRIRPVHGRAADRRQAQHEHHPRARSTTASSARSPRSSAPETGTCGRHRCTTPTSPSTRTSAVPSACA